MSLRLFALVPSAPPASLGVGLEGGALRALPSDGFDVIVEENASALGVTRESLSGHDGVMRALAAQFDALLPVRFGQIVQSQDVALRRLEIASDRVRAALDHVCGCTQMTLRLFGERTPAEEAEVAVAGTGPGSRYLLERAQRARRSREAHELAPLAPKLDDIVRDTRVRRPSTGRLLANVYHLVPRDRVTDYVAEIEGGLPRLSRLTVRRSGPWPVYAFVPEVLS